MSLGRRPTSSANMQKTRRLTKWATSWGSWPRVLSACARAAKAVAARSVRAWRLSPGRSRSGAGHGPFQLVAHGRVGQLVQRELVDDADAVGPVGVDAEAGHVGDDQQGRVFQRQRVLAQLVEGGVEAFALALVFPGEAVAFPHVGPAAAAGVFARAALEAVTLPAGIVLGRVGSPKSRQRSMKCSCAAERSFSSDACHLAIKFCASIFAPTICRHCQGRLPGAGWVQCTVSLVYPGR